MKALDVILLEWIHSTEGDDILMWKISQSDACDLLRNKIARWEQIDFYN